MPVPQQTYDPKDNSLQAGDLITAKLSAPILRSMLVRRARLTELLWAGMQRRLTLVVAPAGYGKTTLLGEWHSTITPEARLDSESFIARPTATPAAAKSAVRLVV